MKYFYSLFFLNFLWLFPGPMDQLANSNGWEFKKEKDGIKVYVRDIANSNLKELRIKMSFENTSIPKILKVLKNANSYKDWVFKCSNSRPVSIISETVDVSYYKFDFPWPLSDRDAYLQSTIEENLNTGQTKITTISVPQTGIVEEDVVRIEDHINTWTFQQVNNSRIDLTYYVKSHPSGNIPNWMINLAIDKGPTNTLSSLRKLVYQQ